MSLSPSDHDRIAAAVGAAEEMTAGQIVCAVTEEAAPYAEVPLTWAVIGALLLPVLALTIARAAGHFDYALGGWSAAHVAAMHAAVLVALAEYALLQALLFLAIFLLVSIPAVRRRLTPASLKQARVRARALDQFVVHGLDRTEGRSGVMIFVALAERRVEVLADRGVADGVDPAVWPAIVADVVAGLRAGDAAGALEAAVLRCGGLLGERFPPRAGRPNELADAVVDVTAR